MLLAKAIAESRPLPAGAILLGYIDRHPTYGGWLGLSVLRMPTGIEVAWDGSAIRSMPRNWRDRVTFTPATT